MYRVYKCQNEYIFDRNYQLNFACDVKDIPNISINDLLSDPLKSYQRHKGNFIKVTGKISKINGGSTIELKGYKIKDNSINGAVNFNDESKLIVKLSSDLSKYKIYDYITVVGLLSSYDKDNHILTLKDPKIEEQDLYNNYTIEVILNSKCNKEATLYMDNYYTYCLNNIFINYDFNNYPSDKYELSYAIKDGKVTMKEILKNAKVNNIYQDKLYNLEKFNILACHNGKNYLLSKNEQVNDDICEN